MKDCVRTMGMAVAAIMLLGMVCMAQEPEPPLTWKGKGVSWFISEEGSTDLEFNVKIHIDEAGDVTGEAYTDDGSASIERLYYGEKIGFEFPEFGARRLILVLMVNEDSDNPSFIVMNGRILADRFCYGEILIKRFEKEGSIEKGLEIGNKMATAIDEDNLSAALRAALKKCVPIGCFKMTGGFAAD